MSNILGYKYIAPSQILLDAARAALAEAGFKLRESPSTPMPLGVCVCPVDTSSMLVEFYGSFSKGSNVDTNDAAFPECATLDEFIEKSVALKKSKDRRQIALNSGYTAEIQDNGNTAKVGCQTFAFDRIEALYLAMKQARENSTK